MNTNTDIRAPENNQTNMRGKEKAHQDQKMKTFLYLCDSRTIHVKPFDNPVSLEKENIEDLITSSRRSLFRGEF